MDIEVNNISAEHILQEVYKKRKVIKPSTKVDIVDLEELRELQRRKRTEYETYLKRNRLDIGQWIRYARFEVEQHDIRRARSIFERALLVDSSHVPLWIRYMDTEIKLKNINHARNLMNRAVSILPRVDKFWYKYLVIEESLGNVDIVRSLFTKWTSLEPGTNAWDSFVDFELRQENWENVRKVFAMYVLVHPHTGTWLRWIQFETVHGDVGTVRKVYSLALDTLVSMSEKVKVQDDDLAGLITSFANWEATQKEYERCRELYRISIEKWPQNQFLKEGLVEFEKRFGTSQSIENTVIHKRRRKYESNLQKNPDDYDTWWIYLDLIQNNFRVDLLTCLDKSVTGTQPKEKIKNLAWKSYIFLWIRYLTYVELECANLDLCRALYQRLISLIPHKNFTFAKIWYMYSQFELRNGDLTLARKILGRSLGLCAKPKIFKLYIDMEIKLREFDRVRKLYEKFIEYDDSSVDTWMMYADLETNLGDRDRAIGIYEISLHPDVTCLAQNAKLQLIQKFINYMITEEEFDVARELYERYLKLAEFSLDAWVKYAFYVSENPTGQQVQELREYADTNSNDEEVEFIVQEVNIQMSRGIFERALKHFKSLNDTESRIALLEEFKNYENIFGDAESQDKIQKRQPKVVGLSGQKEYVFPDDEVPNVTKLQALAKRWEQNRRSE
ncbi:nineTeen Complex (NTC) component [Zygosaccharomyces mellis]|uniref:Pre-mRNA-splicing factor CLF1 n=1 Tax=Zygosaccharomyces mellis TaxID=42258 RepID=A0A4C2E105_9SACH|nr:nineTeen Complex (NTC) component [Zygosaccharomyces mellis]